MRTRRLLCSAVLLAVLAGCGSPATPPAPAGSATTAGPTTAPATPSAAPTAEPGPGAAAGRALLWPFTDAAAVHSWQEAFRTGGAQPWHLEASATALSFTQGFLGFSQINTVTSQETSGGEAWIGVGYKVPGGKTNTAAVVHLVRYGTGQDAPWIVVGTRDTSLGLDVPAYGTRATWPLTVGGTITGVDESIRVRVLGIGGVVGESCCLSAGGQQARWKVDVPQQTPRSGALTVVASSGGHVADVEIFAITAVTG